MARISPFRALHYNPKMFYDASPVVIPPYDNIPVGEEKKYLERSPYNFSHVLLPQGPNEDYSRAANLLEKWRKENILIETNGPCYFLYQQVFEAYGAKHTRRSLMSAVELRDFSEGIIRPHENTFGQYKADRLLILRKTQCNLSHVFAMVKDPQGHLDSQYEKWIYEKPLLVGSTDEGTEHSLWKIEGDKAKGIADFFAEKPIYIVDGHHRYSSALMYAQELGVVGKLDHPAAHMIFCISNAYDPGLIVYPTHRVIKRGAIDSWRKRDISHQYLLTKMDFEELRKFVRTPQKSPQFALYFENELFLCMPKDWQNASDINPKSVRKLSVAWSDQKFLRDLCFIDNTNRSEKISYEKDLNQVWEKRNVADLIVFHAPPAITDVSDVADEKGFMPQKSTFFYPKLAAGFAMRRLTK